MTAEAVLVLDRGFAEIVIPDGWLVLPQPGGSIKVTDPNDDCSLEISYLRYPGLTGPLPLHEFLEQLLAGTPGAAERGPIQSSNRGPMQLAWCTYPFESADTVRNERRPAWGRIALASRGTVVAVLTCYWWEDDDGWARPAVERACETLSLGDGVPLASPADHWTMKERN